MATEYNNELLEILRGLVGCTQPHTEQREVVVTTISFIERELAGEQISDVEHEAARILTGRAKAHSSHSAASGDPAYWAVKACMVGYFFGNGLESAREYAAKAKELMEDGDEG